MSEHGRDALPHKGVPSWLGNKQERGRTGVCTHTWNPHLLNFKLPPNSAEVGTGSSPHVPLGTDPDCNLCCHPPSWGTSGSGPGDGVHLEPTLPLLGKTGCGSQSGAPRPQHQHSRKVLELQVLRLLQLRPGELESQGVASLCSQSPVDLWPLELMCAWRLPAQQRCCFS